MPDQQGFYSKLEEVITNKLPKSATPQQILATVDPAKGSGVKAEELKWTGFAQAVERIAKENGGKVPKEKLMEHLQNEGRVRFEEVTAETKPSDVIDETQYSQYQLPGGQTYREIVLTSDTAAPYTSRHFKDIPNYVAHMRVNERAGPDGRPGLFIEEIQSDRHQQAREKGYAQTKEQMQARLDELLAIPAKDRTFSQDDEITILSSNISSRSAGQTGIPDAPFRKDWSLQMFKRGLRDAVASGKEWIGWTTGETQAERYDLSKQVKSLSVEPLKDGTEKFAVYANGNLMRHASRETLSDVIGKEMAQRALSDIDSGKVAAYRGLDLKVGGEGMKGFYDKILPAEVQKYVKQWGAKVEKATVPTISFEDYVKRIYGSYISEFNLEKPSGESLRILDELKNKWKNSSLNNTPIWRVDITPQMRESVQKTGQARFMPSDTDYLAAVQAGDTQAAQQMVDHAAKAAGYTIKAYHGTTHGGFTEFNVPIENDPEYPVRGIFFSTDKSVPEQFTKRSAYDKETGKSPAIYNAYLKLDKPLVYSAELSSLSETERRNVAEIYKEDLESLEDYLDERPNATVGRYLYQGGATDAEHLDGSVIGYNYDGIIDGSVIIALSPTQIKSADPITRDDSGNVIPLSQRFQTSSADIRYMPQPDASLPGAYNVTGGFRILPGKTGGRLRVYGPSGALVGIAGSLDEAQRMIRRKTQSN